MKRIIPIVVLAAALIVGCPAPEPTLSPEQLAEGAYGLSTTARDGLLLARLQQGPALSAPEGSKPVAANEGAIVAVLTQGVLPDAGTSWTDEFGNNYVVREVDYDNGTQIAIIIVDVIYVSTDPRASATLTFELHTNGTLSDDSDDRMLGLTADTDYRDGSVEQLEYIDLDRVDGDCDVQVDCDVYAGRLRVIANRTFTEDPHLAELSYQVDMLLGDPNDDADDLFEREFYELTRTDGLVYSRDFLPGVPVQPGSFPDEGAITDTVTYPEGSDVTGVSQTLTWESLEVGSIQTVTEYPSGTDDYLVEFDADGTGTITGTRRDGSSVSGTINRNTGRHTMEIALPDGAVVNVEMVFRQTSIDVTRVVHTDKGTITAVAVITGGADGNLDVDYTDTLGYVGEAVLEFRPTDAVLRNAEISTPDDRILSFDFTLNATGDGRVTFRNDGVHGDLNLVPMGGARGVVGKQGAERTIEIDPAGRIR